MYISVSKGVLSIGEKNYQSWGGGSGYPLGRNYPGI